MSSSPKEEQDPSRKNSMMEESNSMTVEFLRARLLSERSVSKSARQRADELAKRVKELEEQLKMATMQRRKAERATADVLAILESHGMSDISDDLDSSSDREEEEETSDNAKSRKNDTGSDNESSSVLGRSLSWKSSKDSTEKKRSMDRTTRRYGSLAYRGSCSSSPKRAGKSCRQIRRRETRSATQESENSEVRTFSEQVNSSSDTKPETSRQGHGEKDLEEDRVSGMYKDHSVRNGQAFDNGGSGGGKDMESALERQAQLIGRYEEEEKAQREWEEKFRENNGCNPDSGNHSDITEERDGIKTPPSPTSNSARFVSSHKQEPKPERQEPKTASSFQPPPPPPQKPDQKPNESRAITAIGSGKDNVGSVMKALQQAKASLQQKLDYELPLIQSGPSQKVLEPFVPASRNAPQFEIPIGCGGLFRVPTDFQPKSTSQTHFMASNSQFGHVQPNSYRDTRLQNSTRTPAVRPCLETGLHYSRRNSYPDFGSSIYNYPSYPFYPDVTPRISPMNEGSIVNRDVRIPNATTATQSSLYGDHIRPNMYR